jgi:hypothetical protein
VFQGFSLPRGAEDPERAGADLAGADLLTGALRLVWPRVL